jgi:ribulose-phosphate 3-epimerase
MKPVRIAPSLLAANFLRLGDEVSAAEKGGADRLHLDVMDGVFVPNISFGAPVIQAVRSVTSMPLEAHLMIANGSAYIADVAEWGADIILIHVENTLHLDRALAQIRSFDRRAGVVLNPATPLGAIDSVVELLDVLLIMTVNPGFGGQKLIDYTLKKVSQARALLDLRNPDCDLEVDGGINEHTIALAVRAGADVIVAGSSVFQHPGGPGQGIASLLSAAAHRA